jgi:acyl carrier protein
VDRVFTASPLAAPLTGPTTVESRETARTARAVIGERKRPAPPRGDRPRGEWSVEERRSVEEKRSGQSVEERVIDIVCENLAVNRDQVKRETAFIEDIGADSLDIVELIMELEEEFEITIPDDQAEKIKTVGEAIDYIQREIAKK